jgi:predicted PurR-regulated permease PerM
LALLDVRASRVLFTALVFAVALAFLYLARHTLVVFLLAILFAYLLEPLVSWLQDRVRGRSRAIAIIYVILLGLVILLFSFVGPRIVHEADKLAGSLPSLLEKVSSGQIVAQIGSLHGWSYRTQQRAEQFIASHQREITQMASHLGLRIAAVAQNVWWLVLIPILAAFFLKDGRHFTQSILEFVPARPQRDFLEGVLHDLNDMLAHFIRAQLTLAALALVVYLVFLSLMRVPYALVLGTTAGILEFLPVVGPFISAVIIVGICLLMSYPHVVVVLAFLAGWRLVQDYVTSPRIMGRSVELHPLAAIFGVLAGGELAGVLGVFLSIPVMASLRIVVRRWRLYADKRRFGPLDGYLATPESRL